MSRTFFTSRTDPAQHPPPGTPTVSLRYHRASISAKRDRRKANVLTAWATIDPQDPPEKSHRNAVRYCAEQLYRKHAGDSIQLERQSLNAAISAGFIPPRAEHPIVTNPLATAARQPSHFAARHPVYVPPSPQSFGLIAALLEHTDLTPTHQNALWPVVNVISVSITNDAGSRPPQRYSFTPDRNVPTPAIAELITCRFTVNDSVHTVPMLCHIFPNGSITATPELFSSPHFDDPVEAATHYLHSINASPHQDHFATYAAIAARLHGQQQAAAKFLAHVDHSIIAPGLSIINELSAGQCPTH